VLAVERGHLGTIDEGQRQLAGTAFCGQHGIRQR
jgi:hypothetical protein